jgi:dipeptidyl aminopeptidase/acylaminoacyl peptidase
VATGEKKLLTPKNGQDEVSYSGGVFSRDGKGFYTTTDRDSEFQRLAYFDLATLQPVYLTTNIKWDVDEFDLSEDGKSLAFVANEDGISKLYLMDTATRKYHAVAGIPTGLIFSITFHKNNRDLDLRSLPRAPRLTFIRSTLPQGSLSAGPSAKPAD